MSTPVVLEDLELRHEGRWRVLVDRAPVNAPVNVDVNGDVNGDGNGDGNGDFGRPGLWRDRPGTTGCERVFEIPPHVDGTARGDTGARENGELAVRASGSAEARGADVGGDRSPLASTLSWAGATAGGQAPDAWQPAPRAELEAGLTLGRLHAMMSKLVF